MTEDFKFFIENVKDLLERAKREIPTEGFIITGHSKKADYYYTGADVEGYAPTCIGALLRAKIFPTEKDAEDNFDYYVIDGAGNPVYMSARSAREVYEECIKETEDLLTDIKGYSND
jgi:hypothetical protein